MIIGLVFQISVTIAYIRLLTRATHDHNTQYPWSLGASQVLITLQKLKSGNPELLSYPPSPLLCHKKFLSICTAIIYRISIALKSKDRLSFQAIEIHLQFYALEYIFVKVKVKFLVSCYLGKNLRLTFTPFL